MKGRLLVLILILIADILSALGVVYARHTSRQLAVELGSLENRRDESMAEWSRLQLEQAWLADAGTIEGKAVRQLRMVQPEDIRILEVRK